MFSRIRQLAFLVAVVMGLLVPAAPASAGHCSWSYGYTSSHSWTSDPCNTAARIGTKARYMSDSTAVWTGWKYSWGTYVAKYPPGYVVDAAACWNC